MSLFSSDKDRNVLNKGISEIATVKIGKSNQGMIIKSKNIDNPILLFLHGGPGNPEYLLQKKYNINLEDFFTVCWWDQRGSGLSYNASLANEQMTLDLMVTDTVEITNYLKKRFRVDKIYIMGHSWGSFLGINVVSNYPELYKAYIGIGQVTNQFESEKLGYKSMLKTAKATGDIKTVNKLKKYNLTNPDAITTKYLMLRSSIMGKQGNGVFHDGTLAKNMLKDIILDNEYSLSGKYGYLMGSLKSLKYPLNKSQYTTNLMVKITEIEIPVYIMHGIHDRQVSYSLSLDYFDKLKAPSKKFYTFENSAHSPFMEEKIKFIKIISNDILEKEI